MNQIEFKTDGTKNMKNKKEKKQEEEELTGMAAINLNREQFQQMIWRQNWGYNETSCEVIFRILTWS